MHEDIPTEREKNHAKMYVEIEGEICWRKIIFSEVELARD